MPAAKSNPAKYYKLNEKGEKIYECSCGMEFHELGRFYNHRKLSNHLPANYTKIYPSTSRQTYVEETHRLYSFFILVHLSAISD